MRFSVYVILSGVLILLLSFNRNEPVQLDGVINDTEWKDAKEHQLSGGGKLLLKKSGNDLYVAMAGKKQAWAHVYLHHGDTVQVIHASAALGEGKYVKQNNLWKNIQTFQWELREKDYNEELVQKQNAHYLKHGWVANNNNMGDGKSFEFKLNLSHSTAISFACVLAEVPLELHYFPTSLSDHTILPNLVQGYTPDSLQFIPASWEKIK